MAHSRVPRRLTLTVCLAVFLAFASPFVAEVHAGDELLSATILGPFVPGEIARLAVKWEGPPDATLDAWVDFDGDGVHSPAEHVIVRTVIDRRMRLFEFPVPTGAQPCRRAALRLQATDARPVNLEASVKSFQAGTCEFEDGFGVSDLDQPVTSFAIYDDGTGPALYVGGVFTVAGGTRVNSVARWDGSGWHPLGTGLSEDSAMFIPEMALAMAVFDDGTGPALYVAGHFWSAGGVAADNIARWDGSAWSPVAGGLTWNDGSITYVRDLVVHDDGAGPALYAAGSFDRADGISARGVARWDGSSWSEVGHFSAEGSCLAVFDDGAGDALFVGGVFDTTASVTVNNIARWSGTAWSALGGGVTHSQHSAAVYAMAVFDDGGGDCLYVGGRFDTAGSLPADNISCWNGTIWGALGSGVTLSDPNYPGETARIDVLTVHDGGSGTDLYVGGNFDTAGGEPASNIAGWNGADWSALVGPSGNGTDDVVRALLSFPGSGGDELWAGGSFLEAGGEQANFVARWADATWATPSAFTGNGLLGRDIYALELFDDGTGPALYVGGDFSRAGGIRVNNIARWDGTTWSPLLGNLDDGVDGRINTLKVFDDGFGPALYAGGQFSTVGGYPANNIARWDGSGWWPAGGGTDGKIYALQVFDDGSGPSLFAGGDFTAAGWVAASNIARFDGSTWWSLGSGTSGKVESLAVFDDGGGPDLYVGGAFSVAGGITTGRVARWDGGAWSALGSGVNGTVNSLAAYGDGSGPSLFASGQFSSAGGVSVRNVARWDGRAWFDVGGGMDFRVYCLEAYRGDAALYAGGFFTEAGGVPANGLARWDGTTWQAVAGAAGNGLESNQTSGWANVMRAVPGRGLFIGGTFSLAAGVPSLNIAQLSCALFIDGFESGDVSMWSAAAP